MDTGATLNRSLGLLAREARIMIISLQKMGCSRYHIVESVIAQMTFWSLKGMVRGFVYLGSFTFELPFDFVSTRLRFNIALFYCMNTFFSKCFFLFLINP